MDSERPLFIPVILGTVRAGRMSEHAARLVTGELEKCPGIQTELIDIAHIPLPTNDSGEAIKNPDFAEKMERADALVIVSPEYNHGYPGLLKHVLDSCLKEYIHKAVGIVGGFCWPVWWCPGHSKPAARYARTGPGDNILGRELLERASYILSGRRPAGRILRPSDRQIPKRIDLDG